MKSIGDPIVGATCASRRLRRSDAMTPAARIASSAAPLVVSSHRPCLVLWSWRWRNIRQLFQIRILRLREGVSVRGGASSREKRAGGARSSVRKGVAGEMDALRT